MSAPSIAGILVATTLAGIALGYLLHRATTGRDQEPDDDLPRIWCPMCERHTLLVHETKLVAERRDEHHDDDVCCRIINGHHYTIRIGSTALLCANCGLPHDHDTRP